MVTSALRCSSVVIAEFSTATEWSPIGWNLGPLPLQFPGQERGAVDRADRTSRFEYFSSRVSSCLFPNDSRWWTVLNGPQIAGLRPAFAEVILPRSGTRSRNLGYVIVHVSGNPVSPMDYHRSLNVIREDLTAVVPGLPPLVNGSGQAAHLTFVNAPPSIAPPLAENLEMPVLTQLAWTVASQWSGTASTYPTNQELTELHSSGGFIEVSRRATFAVVPEGIGLATLDASSSNDPFDQWITDDLPERTFANFVQFQAHTYFADVLLLIVQQRSGLNAIADAFGTVAQAEPRIDDLEELQRDFSAFRAEVWWHQISDQQTANRLLNAAQRTFHLSELLTEVAEELDYMSTQIQTHAAALTSSAIALLSLVLVPLTVGVGLAAALVPSTWSWPWKTVIYLSTIPLSIAAALAGAALLPGYLGFLRQMVRSGKRRVHSTER